MSHTNTAASSVEHTRRRRSAEKARLRTVHVHRGCDRTARGPQGGLEKTSARAGLAPSLLWGVAAFHWTGPFDPVSEYIYTLPCLLPQARRSSEIQIAMRTNQSSQFSSANSLRISGAALYRCASGLHMHMRFLVDFVTNRSPNQQQLST